MRTFAALLTFCFLILVPIGESAPIAGGGAKFEKVGAVSWTSTIRFRGGERATVLVANKDSDKGHFHVLVFDAKTNVLVAEDKNKEASKEDMVGVIWYPARDADYRIEIKNLEPAINSCYVTIK